MLAPGDYLTVQVPPEPMPALPESRVTQTAPAPAPAAATVGETETPEPRSFLQILLNALGAIHT